jgi:hypothetical protein
MTWSLPPFISRLVTPIEVPRVFDISQVIEVLSLIARILVAEFIKSVSRNLVDVMYIDSRVPGQSSVAHGRRKAGLALPPDIMKYTEQVV